MNNQITYKQWAFEFVPGTVNGRPAMFAQVVAKDAMFSVMQQGWFDEYAFRFKFKDWKDMPTDLAAAIHDAYLVQFNPQRKDFRANRPA